MKELEDALIDSSEEFNPILREIYTSFSQKLIELKLISLEHKSHRIEDIVFEPKVGSDNPILTPIKDCNLSIVASFDGVRQEFDINTDCYSDNSKLIDLVIGLNSFGNIDNYSDDYSNSLLRFATMGTGILAPTSKGAASLEPEIIIYLEADITRTRILTTDGRIILSTKNLKYFEDILPRPKFIRIHSKHIVNTEFVGDVDYEKLEIEIKPFPTLQNPNTKVQTKLTISRNYKQLFIYIMETNFNGKAR